MIAYHGKNASRMKSGAGGGVCYERILGLDSTETMNAFGLLLVTICGGPASSEIVSLVAVAHSGQALRIPSYRCPLGCLQNQTSASSILAAISQ